MSYVLVFMLGALLGSVAMALIAGGARAERGDGE
jgi:hypothetical protein